MADVKKYLVTCDAKPLSGVVHFYVWAEDIEQALYYAGATITTRDMPYLTGKPVSYLEVVKCRFEYTSPTCIFVYDSEDRLWFTVQTTHENPPKSGDTEFMCYLDDRSIVDDFTYRGGYVVYESSE